MIQPPNGIALLYDDDAYVETLRRSAQARGAGPMGLMGRQVAGKEFLDAYLSHGSWKQLVALVRNQQSAESLKALWQTHPGTRAGQRSLEILGEQGFHQKFFPMPPATLLYVPGPADARYAWARQHAGPASYSLSGVTYTICTPGVVQLLCSLVTAPFESYDSLICISEAGRQMVRTVTGIYADYLRERHGGQPAARIRLEVIPLGVNTEKFRPPTGDERLAQRRALNIADDEVGVLFVGRMSFHAKAHPFPMFAGVAEAVKRTGQKVHLVISGWAANDFIARAFRSGAESFAPGVRVSFVDSLAANLRFGIWHAADIFTSLSDNIQETFGLVLPQAMACGLPVVASDWDGYRDIVVNGETGYLIPTYMVKDATADATARLILEEVNYDNFLAECNQTVAVDVAAAADAYTRLMGDASWRRKMGLAGRQRALDTYAWPHIIRAYENLWAEQERERATAGAAAGQTPSPCPLPPGERVGVRGPAIYPAPERSFACFPTRLLSDDDQLEAVPGAATRLDRLFTHPLINYADSRRCTDGRVLRAALDVATRPCSVQELDSVFRKAGLAQTIGRSTMAWMLKYGLLSTVSG